MDFTDTPAEAAFRAEAREFLEANAKPKSERHVLSHAIVAEWPPEVEREKMAAATVWQAVKYDAGWAGIAWPREYGGRGGTTMEAVIFAQEEGHFDVPHGELAVGLGWCGPCVAHMGETAQKHRFLPPLLRGDEVWCQLFSEPSAGSDVAQLGTRAVRDGDEWVITGQKVWTTFAHMSDWGLLVARTDPEAPKHHGMTAFVLDMRQPQVECRPLRQMTGAANFNEVFFDGARVADVNRIGAVGDGWRAITTTFMYERTGGGVGSGIEWELIFDLLRDRSALGDAVVRQRLMRAWTQSRAMAYTGLRLLTALSQGRLPGPEGSISKLTATRVLSDLFELCIDVQGPAGILAHSDAPLAGEWQAAFLGMPGLRIGGGTDEIQRNIIGERVLGLPPEPRVDKGVPWHAVPVGRAR